ncbi:MAG: hypothetical protein V4543_13140, partial [Bacteroidota bacterium]
MTGHRFSKFIPRPEGDKPGFDRLNNIFRQLLTITGGDVAEALQWMADLDRQYNLTDNNYGLGNFIEDLKDKGYIKENEPGSGVFVPTAKTEQDIRKSALEE